MNIDGMVRETLHSYADGAPLGAGLLDAAQARARRRRARHAGLATAAAVAAVLVAVSIPFGASVGEGPAVPGSGPPPVAMAPPSFDLPSFPVTPEWVPDGVAPAYVSASYWWRADEIGESYELGDDGEFTEAPGRIFPELGLTHPPGPEEYAAPLSVTRYAGDPNPQLASNFGDEGEEITVQGQPGTRYQGRIIVWEHEPGYWLVVWGDASLTQADVERYAQELEPTPLPAEAAFTFDLLPAGAEATGFSADEMHFEAADGVQISVTLSWDERATGPVLFSPPPTAEPPVEPSASAPVEDPGSPGPSGSPGPPSATPIEVDGRPAELTDWGDGTSVDIYLEQDWVLSVSGTLNRDDLLAIAEGIELTSLAWPPGVLSPPR